MLPIDMKHDPATGEWSIVTGEQRLHAFKALRWPDCDVWWQSVRRQCPEEAEQLRGEDVRRQFNATVERIQDGCYCQNCREAVDARPRPYLVPPPVIPAKELLGSLGTAARITRMDGSFPPLTYAQARRRYMDTGAIADKEVMLAAVTLTVPDLDTLGRDWEPAAPEIVASERRQGRARRQGVAEALAVAGAVLAAVAWVAMLASAYAAIACSFIAVAIALFPWPKRRR